MVYDIFLSYSRTDKELIKPLAEKLQHQGWSVWWDIKITPGKPFDEVIEAALDSSKCVVVIWSKASISSRWVKTEANEAMKENRLVPARIDDVNPPLAFRSIQTADLSNWNEDASHGEFKKLIKAISLTIDEVKLKERLKQEELYWDNVQSFNTIESYAKYLAKYPNGKYKDEALIQYNQMERKNEERRIKEEARNIRMLRYEELLWQDVKKKNSIDSYRRYIFKYPEGKFINVAYERMKELGGIDFEELIKFEDNLKNERQEESIWQSVKNSNSIQDIDQYLAQYPNGKYSGEAFCIVKELERIRAEEGRKKEKDFLVLVKKEAMAVIKSPIFQWAIFILVVLLGILIVFNIEWRIRVF